MGEKLEDSDFEIHFTNNSKEDKEKSLEEFFKQEKMLEFEETERTSTTRYPGILDSVLRKLKKGSGQNYRVVSMFTVRKGVKELMKDKELVERGKQIGKEMDAEEDHAKQAKLIKQDYFYLYDEIGKLNLTYIPGDAEALNDRIFHGLSRAQLVLIAFIAGASTSQEWISSETRKELKELYKEIKETFLKVKLVYKYTKRF